MPLACGSPKSLGRYDYSDPLTIHVTREDFFYEGKDGLTVEWLLMKYTTTSQKNNLKVTIHSW